MLCLSWPSHPCGPVFGSMSQFGGRRWCTGRPRGIAEKGNNNNSNNNTDNDNGSSRLMVEAGEYSEWLVSESRKWLETRREVTIIVEAHNAVECREGSWDPGEEKVLSSYDGDTCSSRSSGQANLSGPIRNYTHKTMNNLEATVTTMAMTMMVMMTMMMMMMITTMIISKLAFHIPFCRKIIFLVAYHCDICLN